MDSKKLEKAIQEAINKLRNLGEHTRKGSDHLYFRSISKFKLSGPKKTIYKGKDVYEVKCEYDIYTETEFLHTTEMDELYTEHYRDKFLVDKNLKVLDIEDLRKNK
ncbi:MAG: hypothetical protein ACFFA6_13800 [Promethearchaeota archaeon]